VFAPAAFALIGTLPSDLHSRCICINLKRKLKGEKVETYRIGRMHRLDELARKIARWAADNADTIADARPELPAGVDNRWADLWVVLLSIAKVAGGDWPERAEKAIKAATEIGDDDGSLLEQLLADIDVVFARRKEDEVSSDALVADLVDMEGRPWPELGKGRKSLTKAKLARMLRVPGVSVSPGQVKGGKLRGYKRSQFDDIFARYLPNGGGSQSVKVSEPLQIKVEPTLCKVSFRGVLPTLSKVSVPQQNKGPPTLRHFRRGVQRRSVVGGKPRCTPRQRAGQVVAQANQAAPGGA
jgi:hypothetical protein